MSAQSPVPSLNPQGLKQKEPRDYIVRFAFGVSISLSAALLSLKYQLLGGVFLGFPAILPASLTLVERDSGRTEAAIDAEGAIIGSLGMLAFALVAAFGIKPLGVIAALIGAAVAWVIVSLTGYAVVMAWRAATTKHPRRAAPG